MDNRFMIPANTKKGQLILSIFRPVDLGIAITGASITFILLIVFSNMDLPNWVNLLAVVPGLLCFALVFFMDVWYNICINLEEKQNEN